MRNFTDMGYETITVIRSEYPPELGKCLDISPVLWIQTIENTNNVSKEEKKFFVFARNNCMKEIYEISQAISDFVDGIITPCGIILPIDNKIEFLDSEGIGLECVDGKIKFVIKAPLDTTLGGTGFISFNEGDILVGNADGKLSILIKGEIGQVLGVKENGSLGFIKSSSTAPIQKFIVSPCGELTPDAEGKVGLELSEDFSCELSEDKSTSKVGIKKVPSSAIEKIITSCGEITPINGVVKFTTGEGLESICESNEVTNKLKTPVATNLGGTGQEQYNKGDVLVGKEDGSLEKLPKGQVGQALGIDSNGNLAYIDISGGGGTKKIVAATARFPVTTITWGQNNWYVLGSQGNVGYIKIRDQDGDNFQANNLQVGNGTLENYVVFTVPYAGLWAVSYQATFEVNNLDTETIIQHSVAWGKSYETAFRLREFDSFSTAKRKSIVGTKVLPFEKGDIVFIEVYIGRDPSDPNLQVTMRSYWNPPSFDSYVGFGLIEEGSVTIPTT